MEESELLTSVEVADILKMEPETVLVWISKNRFPNATRIGGSRKMLRIPRSDVDALIEQGRV